MNRLCTDCGERELRHNNKSGLCRFCYEKNRPRNQVGSAEWQKRNEWWKGHYDETKAKKIAYQRRYKFKIDDERFFEMLREQNYACALCERRVDELADASLHIDHDHTCCPTTRIKPRTCGECVRSLLCRECNFGMGYFRDDKILLEKAVAYLDKHRNER